MYNIILLYVLVGFIIPEYYVVMVFFVFKVGNWFHSTFVVWDCGVLSEKNKHSCFGVLNFVVRVVLTS